MFSEILNKTPRKSKWATWVASDDSRSAKETRAFLDTCFLNIPSGKRLRLSRKIQKGDEAEVEALIYELVAHELLRRLGHAPEFNPVINGLTPDIYLEVLGQRFIVDVFVTHSPSKTVTNFGDGSGEAFDQGDRAQKISDSIRKKSLKYAKTGLPLLLFAFLGDRYILSAMHVERALFGITVNEISPEERFPEDISTEVYEGGVLLPDERGMPGHPNLSAVLVCDWFDTLNRKNRGKRLYCLVLHHWNPKIRLPVGAFRDFAQVTWNCYELGRWCCKFINDQNIVARFVLDDEIEFGRYTADNPW